MHVGKGTLIDEKIWQMRSMSKSLHSQMAERTRKINIWGRLFRSNLTRSFHWRVSLPKAFFICKNLTFLSDKELKHQIFMTVDVLVCLFQLVMPSEPFEDPYKHYYSTTDNTKWALQTFTAHKYRQHNKSPKFGWCCSGWPITSRLCPKYKPLLTHLWLLTTAPSSSPALPHPL